MATRERTYPGHTHSSELDALGAPVTPVPLMQIATGFWAFKTLAAAHELDLFTPLGRRRRDDRAGARARARHRAATGGDAADRLRVARPARTRPRTATAIRRSASEFLVRGTPYYFGGLVTMFDRRLYPGWAKLTEAIRTNRPTTWDPERQRSHVRARGPGGAETFWEAMHSLSGFTARTLGDAIDLDAATRLLDVGGGSGAFAIELCRRYPSLRATVFDLPHVIDIAADKIADAELARSHRRAWRRLLRRRAAARATTCTLYSMIMHDWNQEHDRLLLRKSFDALPNGGTDRSSASCSWTTTRAGRSRPRS